LSDEAWQKVIKARTGPTEQSVVSL
jgi:hypothetical protein